MATGTYAPDPDLRIVDANGVPISGGLIWTYLAGTVTPIATYSDVGLTVPNGNPIVAGSDGRFTAFLTPGVSYKFVYEGAATPPAHGPVIITRDNLLAFPGTANPVNDNTPCQLRLTSVAGSPIVLQDVTAITSMFIEPFRGNRIALYDGATWNLRTVASTSFPLTTGNYPANTNFDVFASDSGGNPGYIASAWASDTARATGLAFQDGVLVQSGIPTRRYLGTFRTTSVAGQTEDSTVRRYIWDNYNRIPRSLLRVEPAGSWTYTNPAYRQANGNPANQVEIVVGYNDCVLDLSLLIMVANNSASATISFGFGIDGATGSLNGGGQAITLANSQILSVLARYVANVPLGRHTYAWLESSTAGGVTTWYGTGAVSGNTQCGLFGSIQA